MSSHPASRLVATLWLLGLAACSGGGALGPRTSSRPGLGTEYGEDRYSPVHHVAFKRAGGPLHVATLHYNDRAGVEALRARWLRPCRFDEPVLRDASGPGVVIQVVDENGQPLPAWHVGERVVVEGEAGRRYALLVRNHTARRLEVVASVDGLDVIDGRPADLDKRGYIVAPFGWLLIEGFRRSTSEVAAFRFGTVADSYAARTSGDRNVGVIGVALFGEAGAGWADPELDREAQRREAADPFPGRFARPPL